MAQVPVYNVDGKKTGEVEISDEALGGRIRPQLLKQAIVTYLDHQRQRSSRTRGRSMVEGSTRKLYRQKGTGNARMGTIRTPIRRGGGVTFAKQPPFGRKRLPRRVRSLAWKNAMLVKIRSEDALVLDGLTCDTPGTKALAQTLRNVGADAGCLIATPEVDRNIYLSGRNLPKTEIRPITQMNAYEILRRKKLVLTRPAFEALAALLVTDEEAPERKG